MKKLITLLLIVLFISSFGFANDSRNASETSNCSALIFESTGLAGQVKDAKTGEFLTGVKLTIVGTDIATYTDFDGIFEFNNLQPGKYQLKANYISCEEMITVDYLLKSKELQSINVFLKNLVD